MSFIANIIISILNLFLSFPFVAAGCFSFLKIFFFIKAHILFSITVVMAIFASVLGILKISGIKKYVQGHWRLYFIAISIYMYISFIMGSSFSLENIFNTVSPIKVIYNQFEQRDSFLLPSLKFPFWKIFSLRLWNDLPLQKKGFPVFHYIVRSDFYYYTDGANQRKIDNSKQIICIFKNLGCRPIKLKQIKNAQLRRNTTIIDNTQFQLEYISINKQTGQKEIQVIKGLVEVLNFLTSSKPVILYPLEEVVLFSISPACTGELLIIDVEIEYNDVRDEAGAHSYRQIDEVQFKSNSPRTLEACTKYSCLL